MKKRKKCCYLPPDNYVYGLKHPKTNGITGVAASLQYYETPINNNISKFRTIPNFILMNKLAAQLGLTKVSDIHPYRKIITNHPKNQCACYHTYLKKNPIPDIIHGRKTWYAFSS
ncbi:hypothetical protein I4U23_008189 [Adineta vaga]|nr:hypothetical protein I4U23_008189 [Adineta vaga]